MIIYAIKYEVTLKITMVCKLNRIANIGRYLSILPVLKTTGSYFFIFTLHFHVFLELYMSN